MENDKMQESDLPPLDKIQPEERIYTVNPPTLQQEEIQTDAPNEITLRRTVSQYSDMTSTTTECHCECEGCSIISKFLGL